MATTTRRGQTGSNVIGQIREVVGDPAADSATAQLVRSIVDNSVRLGLVWRIRPATVFTPSATGPRVVVDGTTVAIRAVSLIGGLVPGDRVMVVLTPPSGVHVIGRTVLPGSLSTTVGGQQWESTGAALATIAGTEAVTGLETGEVPVVAGFRYRVHTKMVYVATVSAATTWWILRVRIGSLVGTQVGERVFSTANTTYGEELEFTSAVRPTSTGSVNYVLTAQRLTGAASLSVNLGGTTNSPFMVVHQDCPEDLLTWS